MRAGGDCCPQPMCRNPDGTTINPLTTPGSQYPVYGTYPGGFTGFRPGYTQPYNTGSSFSNHSSKYCRKNLSTDLIILIQVNLSEVLCIKIQSNLSSKIKKKCHFNLNGAQDWQKLYHSYPEYFPLSPMVRKPCMENYSDNTGIRNVIFDRDNMLL